MEAIAKRFVDSVIEAERSLLSAEHVLKVIMPVVKDSKLLLRALETAHKSAVNIISTILKYEHIHGRIDLSQDAKINQELFFSKCAGIYGLSNEEKEKIKQLLILGKKHKEAGFEFSRTNRAVIMDEHLHIDEITRTELEDFIRTARKLLLNARAMFSQGR